MARTDQLVEWVRPLGKALLGAEIGVWEGRLSTHLLRHLPELSLYMIDSWQAPEPDSRYARTGDLKAVLPQSEFDKAKNEAFQRTEFAANRRRILHMTSVEAAKLVRGNTLDFIFIDADHSYEGVAEDLRAWVPKVCVGGIVSGHDIHWDGVHQAVHEYLDTMPGVRLKTGDETTWMFVR